MLGLPATLQPITCGFTCGLVGTAVGVGEGCCDGAGVFAPVVLPPLPSDAADCACGVVAPLTSVGNSEVVDTLSSVGVPDVGPSNTIPAATSQK